MADLSEYAVVSPEGYNPPLRMVHKVISCHGRSFPIRGGNQPAVNEILRAVTTHEAEQHSRVPKDPAEHVHVWWALPHTGGPPMKECTRCPEVRPVAS